MNKRMLLLFILILVITISPNTSSAVTINAGEAKIFRVEFFEPVNSHDTLVYTLAASTSWQGNIDIYDELSDSAPIYHDDTSGPISFNANYYAYTYPDSHPSNFDDLVSFVKINPLSVINMDVTAMAETDLGGLNNYYRIYADVSVVPEPSTMLLLGSGLAGLVGYGRRRMKK